MYERIKRFFLGGALDPQDPRVFHQISLVAFLAWVGLGADGLSSSCYGPEEAYLALHGHVHLAIFLAIATAGTVLIISHSYKIIMELFPGGGGGYVVATRLLGSTAGVVSGSALVIDYILTISISVASGINALFSFLPHEWVPFRLAAAGLVVLLLIYLNLRGVKESIRILLPIFLVFLVAHAIIITLSIVRHTTALPHLLADTAQDTRQAVGELGIWGVLFLFFKAYSLGGGTYTGIEAVSNGLPMLREPRVRTGKTTMNLMAVSLALTAGGLLIGYLLNAVQAEHGRTLNAQLVDTVIGGFRPGGLPVGPVFAVITLVSEAALLFVAAQAGFLDGPRVLSSMAVDSWIPHRFSHLSDRLVIKNGIMLMGLSALAILLATRGRVQILVVMYSINVFITFTLSQLGMCRHWLEVRRIERTWLRKFLPNFVGLVLSAGILVMTMVFKFTEGGWVTVILTGLFVAVCFVTKSHYGDIKKLLRNLDERLMNIPAGQTPMAPRTPDPRRPTAGLLVTKFDGLGIHSILTIKRLFHNHYGGIVFLSVGIIDSSRFKGVDEVQNLQAQTREDLEKYVAFCAEHGLPADFRYVLGTDAVDEIVDLTLGAVKDYPQLVLFAGKLVFAEEQAHHRLLHNETAAAVQRRLHLRNVPMMILPIKAD